MLVAVVSYENFLVENLRVKENTVLYFCMTDAMTFIQMCPMDLPVQWSGQVLSNNTKLHLFRKK